ncbi:ICMT-domain-containing protein [Leucogyrophana mollusca]|uniref:ICMT-domain-containing protein n=1 Tax=Leucogyrophana mollusca TaxID=85980 RepID=A0ACB8BTQ6_9AGAM|nr:ICMT-domain-containing protein [Leucogyrophana mollusca]
MSLTKFPFIFASTYSFSSAFVRPTPPSEASERVKGPFYERFLPYTLPVVLRTIAWIPCVAEGAVVLSTNLPSPTSSKILSALLQNGQLPSFTPDRYVIAGAAVTILGSIARLWAIRTLGRHFTHELSIKKEHKLVTDGPYAWVRHPSYTAGAVTSMGLIILHASPGSLVRACGWLDSWVGRTLVGIWMAQFLSGFAMTLARSVREDGYLRAHFGAEWDRYAERTRYRLIPGFF